VSPDEDPGWGPSIKHAFLATVPFWGRVIVRRRGRGEPGLIAMRTMYLGLVLALPLWVVAFSFLAPWDGSDEGVAPYIVVVAGAAALGLTVGVRQRSLSASSPRALAGRYRSRMFIGIGIAETTALISIVTTFVIQNSLWLIVLGVAFSLTGLWVAAPSRRNLDRDQDRLREQGSPISLVAALNSTPPS
jgi:F0F1-type ATP synthase membrane subunit c/vacuolar-type H+-ATPase subunit K